jgi:catechol 2,3-dioxygenase-like lactoylglutathione lyase family enzyme
VSHEHLLPWRFERTNTRIISKVDHTGITVSSLADAMAFWIDVLGFRHLYTWKFENTPFIENRLGVIDAEISIAMVEGYGHKVELIEYQAPSDRKTMKPRSCDVGSVHIGFYVDDMDVALARVSQAQCGNQWPNRKWSKVESETACASYI